MKTPDSKTVRTRIAPSPTGENLHIGNLYTALINFAVARKGKGQFVVRVEDTDRERLVKGAEEKILHTLTQYGIQYDEAPNVGGPFAPYRQSDRLEIYAQYAQELLENGHAYYCFCTRERLEELRKEQQAHKQTPRYDKHCLRTVTDADERVANGETYVIRLNVEPDKTVYFHDVVRGNIEFNTNEIDDQVLIKSDGFPTYHMAVVIDDHLMEISHIIRAEEWISSTPKHTLLYQAFGWEMPIFAHVPILRNPDRSKLSKRKNPVWAQWYLEEGYLPEAVLNYLALMGWSHPEEKEIFPLSEFIEQFDLSDLKAVGPIFDLTKLTWMNGMYIRELEDTDLLHKLLVFNPHLKEIDQELLEKFIPIAKTRMKTLKEFEGLIIPFVHTKEVALSDEDTKNREKLRAVLEKVTDWNMETLLPVVREFVTESGKNFSYLYTILIGEKQGLPLIDVFEIIGKEKTLDLLS